MKSITGEKDIFAIEFEYFDDSKSTEISMYVDNENILAFNYRGEIRTTRWNLDDIALWLRNFVDNIKNDPYPVDVVGNCAAEKDINARIFDSEDEEEFDRYYDMLDEWNEHHRWHQHSNGGIIADLYFQQIENEIEISWNNLDDEVDFVNKIGCVKVEKTIFISVINEFLVSYAEHWF